MKDEDEVKRMEHEVCKVRDQPDRRADREYLSGAIDALRWALGEMGGLPYTLKP